MNYLIKICRSQTIYEVLIVRFKWVSDIRRREEGGRWEKDEKGEAGWRRRKVEGKGGA